MYSYKLKEKESGEKAESYESFDCKNLFKKRIFNNETGKRELVGTEEYYIGEVIYDGGGNFFVMYKDEETCKKVTNIFTKELLKKRPGLNVLCTCIEASDNYREDQKKLYKKHRVNENQESTVTAWGTLPIVQVDYISSMPLTKKPSEKDNEGNPIKITAESYAKYQKFYEINKEEQIDKKILDKLV